MLREKAIQEALDNGLDPTLINLEEPVWEWVKPNCDPVTEKCDYGLPDAPPEEVINGGGSNIAVEPEKTKIVYEDCSGEQSVDLDCVEYWSISCAESNDLFCLISTLSDSCTDTDMGCQVNFLRAYCDKFDLPICKTSNFERGLQKVNGCLPGQWECIGF